MKQHMMTHKLRDMPQHMFASNAMDHTKNRSPDRPKESASLRVKSEAELSPRSTENNRHSTRDRDARDQSLPPQFQSQLDNGYQLMYERHQQMQLQQQQQQQSSRRSPLHLSHFHRQQSISMSPPPRSTSQTSPQHIKSEHVRQKPSSLDIDQPNAKRPMCKFQFDLFFSIFFLLPTLDTLEPCQNVVTFE